MSDPAVTGGCLCGGVRFELTRAGAVRRATATARAASAAPAPPPPLRLASTGATFRLLQGGQLIKAWRPPDGGFEKCFCSECGAHLFSRDPDDPAHMGIRLGAFDGDPGVRPAWRAFVAYAAPWEPIPDDGLERFPEGKPR